MRDGFHTSTATAFISNRLPPPSNERLLSEVDFELYQLKFNPKSTNKVNHVASNKTPTKTIMGVGGGEFSSLKLDDKYTTTINT